MLTVIGFTGTRQGMTPAQFEEVVLHLSELSGFAPEGVVTFHHGGCVGADRQFHLIARDLWGHAARVVIHPMSNSHPELRDWSDADELRDPAPNAVRNEAIVLASRGGLLVACPAAPEHAPESRRSGTWQTVRIARRLGCGALLFLPDGTRASDGTVPTFPSTY